MLNALMNQRPVTIKEWKLREIRSICSFFVNNKFVAQRTLEVDQLRVVATKVQQIHLRQEGYLAHILMKEAPDLRRYMMVRSSFNINAAAEGDWLNKELIKIFRVTEEDMEWFFKRDHVPQELLNKLAAFGPEALCEADKIDSIRIEYDFWGFGGPIKVIDTDWDDGKKDRVDVKRYLSQYSAIEVYPESNEMAVMEDDLPF